MRGDREVRRDREVRGDREVRRDREKEEMERRGKPGPTHPDKLQVGERSDVEVGGVLWGGSAAVQLAAAAADRQGLLAVRPSKRRGPVQTEIGGAHV